MRGVRAGLGVVAVAACSIAGIQPAGATAAITIERDVVYGTAGGDPLRLDAYLPDDGRTDRAAIVLVHGGAWAMGDKSQWAAEGQALAARGVVGLAINYRTARAGRYPNEVTDTNTAVDWIQDHARRYGVHAGRIGLWGVSAGGHIVMLAALERADPHRPPVGALVTWSAPTDLALLPQAREAIDPTRHAPSGGCKGDVNCVAYNWPNGIASHFGCTYARCPQRYADASPVRHVTATAPPMRIVNSAAEVVPAVMATTMGAALEAVGVASEVTILPGDLHGDAYAASQTAPAIDYFGRELLRPTVALATAPEARGLRDQATEPTRAPRSGAPIAAIAGLAGLVGLGIYSQSRRTRVAH